MMMTPSRSRTLNALGLLVICGILLAAFIDQWVNFDLPCPLCLLQRVGLVAVGFGLCLNVLHGPRPHHYGMMIVAAVLGVSVSIRQILLHIVPGTGSYGDAFLGLHFYTWAGLAFFCIILGSGIMLLFDGQYARDDDAALAVPFGGALLPRAAFFLMVALAGGNAVSALLECGPGICDDPPTNYKLLEELEADA
jgi:disulfide bond formation protein DsbB